jgi:hypothetical protein
MLQVAGIHSIVHDAVLIQLVVPDLHHTRNSAFPKSGILVLPAVLDVSFASSSGCSSWDGRAVQLHLITIANICVTSHV